MMIGENEMELNDYHGEFNPDLKPEDFSKDALIRLVEIAGKNLTEDSGLWYQLVREKYGLEVATDFFQKVWTKKDSKGIVDDMRRLLPAFNIKGNDIATVFKYLQLTSALGIFNFPLKFEMKNKNYGTMTIPECKSLNYFEKHGKRGLLATFT